MKRKTIITIISAVMGLFLHSTPQFADTQGVSYGGTFSGSNIVDSNGNMAKPKVNVEINREPIPTVQLAIELVEILPGETRALTSDLSRMLQIETMLRTGSTITGSMAMKADGSILYNVKVVRLDRDGLTLDITITDNSNKVLATRTLLLRNYEEGIIEFASAENGDKRLALRFLPTIKTIPPVQDFPALLRSFALSGLLIRNGDELLSRGIFVSSTLDNLTGEIMSFITFNSQRTGFLVMSYRPFSGAKVAGYFEDKKLIFEWNGDTYECLSMDKPFLPDGKWAAYFWQAAPGSPALDPRITVGIITADPKELPKIVDRMMNTKPEIFFQNK
jgi:hypothetical protein